MGSFRDFQAYQKAIELAKEVFNISKRFPPEEKYSLTDQVRRSSRSVCANFAEAYGKRKCQKHFVSKLADSDTENTETQVWLDFSHACEYMSEDEHKRLASISEEAGGLLSYMMMNPEKFV
jgi:four helix bundle protein